MKICTHHWKALKKALVDRGLERWLSRSEQDIKRSIERGIDNPEGFEPLVDALRNLVYIGGFYNFVEALDKECGICVLEERRKKCGCKNCKTGLSWIELLAENELDRARKLQLVAPPS